MRAREGAQRRASADDCHEELVVSCLAMRVRAKQDRIDPQRLVKDVCAAASGCCIVIVARPKQFCLHEKRRSRLASLLIVVAVGPATAHGRYPLHCDDRYLCDFADFGRLAAALSSWCHELRAGGETG